MLTAIIVTALFFALGLLLQYVGRKNASIFTATEELCHAGSMTLITCGVICTLGSVALHGLTFDIRTLLNRPRMCIVIFVMALFITVVLYSDKVGSSVPLLQFIRGQENELIQIWREVEEEIKELPDGISYKEVDAFLDPNYKANQLEKQYLTDEFNGWRKDKK